MTANRNKDKTINKHIELSETFNSFSTSRVENQKIWRDIDKQEPFHHNLPFFSTYTTNKNWKINKTLQYLDKKKICHENDSPAKK